MKSEILELTRGHIKIRVGERTATLLGEMLVRGPGIPDFVAYSDTLEHWDPPNEQVMCTPLDRGEILSALRLAAEHKGLTVEIE
jgi:hypothetical protein